MDERTFSLIGLALVWGARHGLDWDHVAAISDITGTNANPKHGAFVSLFYVLGHGSIVAFLGIPVVFLGIRLPTSIDKLLSPFVGITLIILGVSLLFSVFRKGKSFRMQNRWFLLFKHIFKHKHKSDSLSLKTSYLVGIIHGIGAQTPTQLVLFLTAGNVQSGISGALIIFSFIFGIIFIHSVLTILSILGYSMTSKNPFLHISLGIIGGIFSLIVGFSLFFAG